jgi:raffinose/stachyose/melibiose transport system substrate-binding protein
MFNGDWQNAVYDKDLPDNVGFFVFPSATDGGPVAAMSAPLTYGIANTAKNADCAAAFFNWVATNETARQIDVTVGGSNPGGPTDLPVPPAAAGSVINETLKPVPTSPRTTARWTSSPTPRARSRPG